MEIGGRLKALRLTIGLTQEELASRAELTKGYISQLENNICSPSIATLSDILSILGTDLAKFFSVIEREKVVFNKTDFFESENGDGFNTWLIPNSQKNEMEPIMLTLPANGSSKTRYPFEGEEFGYVIEGKIAIVTLQNTFTAKHGEAFYIKGNQEHKIVNPGLSKARLLWITTPSNF
ncbi:MAG: helix-turn-helix domain-containing protein [Christensenellaceae bacterium]|jgi:transcriptional regulator with XRE-family HTH domain|nr:helix-turn-helix domain-containing protein [Christensenellaceae bacterium]